MNQMVKLTTKIIVTKIKNTIQLISRLKIVKEKNINELDDMSVKIVMDPLSWKFHSYREGGFKSVITSVIMVTKGTYK